MKPSGPPTCPTSGCLLSVGGITKESNNPADETYILRLLKQVITVSLETVALVNALPPLAIMEPEAVSEQ